MQRWVGRATRIAVGLAVAWAVPAMAEDADPLNGADIFKKCRACHQVGPGAKNAIGPVLNGVLGRKAGTSEAFSYSDANKNSGVTWDEATFSKYIADPRGFMPGNKMAFAGLKDPLDIKDLVAYLKQFDATGAKK